MSRTVTALYDSRSDAEAARGRLVAGIKTQSTRIIAKDTAAAVDSLKIETKDAQTYRDAIRQGCHLLVAEIEAGHDPKRVITLLEHTASDEPDAAQAAMPETPTYGLIGVTDERPAEPRIAPPAVAAPVKELEVEAKAEEPARAAVAPPVQEERIPLVEEELRVGTRQMSRGGARVRSVVRETPAEEQVALNEEHVDVENRPSERRISLEDVKAGGLLKERIFEIREMREEPVITKETFVREEIIVRKTVQERTETIRDTVRRTEVEVQELPPRDEPARSDTRRGFFGGRPDRK